MPRGHQYLARRGVLLDAAAERQSGAGAGRDEPVPLRAPGVYRQDMLPLLVDRAKIHANLNQGKPPSRI